MASILRVDELQHSDGSPVSPASLNMDAQGLPVQMLFKQSHTLTRATYSANTYYALPDMTVVITPKSTNSVIAIQWIINVDTSENMGYSVYKNGSLAPNGRNTNNSSRWSTYAVSQYDQNVSSTPGQVIVHYFDNSPGTGQKTYELRAHSTNGNAYSFAMNLPWAGAATGQDSYELMVSTWQATEFLK